MFRSHIGLVTCVLCFLIFPSSLEPTQNTLRHVFGVSQVVIIGFPKTPKCFHTIHFFRHGVRSPPMKGILSEEQAKRLEEMSSGVLGSLTTIGKKEMYDVGQSLRSRYGSFINGYHSDKVTVTSTSSSRTIISALSVMAAMFPPSPAVFRNIPWQPIPVGQNTHDMDMSFMYLTPNFQEYTNKVCPAYGKLISQGFGELKSPDERPENSLIYNIISFYTNSAVTSVLDLASAYDTLNMVDRNGIELPDWATAPQPDLGLRPLYPDVMLPFLKEHLAHAQFYHRNEMMLKLFSGPIFYAVAKQFQEVSLPSLSDEPEMMRLHFTHDCTIYSILRAMKVNEPVCPEPGDGVVFELHDEDVQKTVKIFYFNALKQEMSELQSPLCQETCTLDKFIASFNPLSPQQWSELCHEEKLLH